MPLLLVLLPVLILMAKRKQKMDGSKKTMDLNQLPDEILLCIFNLVLDLKYLIYCSLVSHRFSTLISQVHSLSFSVLPRSNPSLNLYVKSLIRFFYPRGRRIPNQTLNLRLHGGIISNPLQIISQIQSHNYPLYPIISSFYGSKALYFPTRFRAIHSLHLVLSSTPRKPIQPNSHFNWKAKFGPNTTIQTFIFLYHTSITKGGPPEYSPSESESESHSHPQRLSLAQKSLNREVFYLASMSFDEAILRHRMLLLFVRGHPMLENISITDSKKQGTLVLRGAKLVEMRSWIDSNSDSTEVNWNWTESEYFMGRCNVPVLKLPVSRQIMEGAMLLLWEMKDHDGSNNGDVAALVDVFEQGDGGETFAEALGEMAVNHKSRMTMG